MNVVKFRTGSAVKHETKTGLLTIFLHYDGLTTLENRRLQLHLSWHIDTMDIAEGRGQGISASLERVKARRNLDGILRRGVELGPCPVRDAILFSSDHARLEIKNEITFMEPFYRPDGDTEVLLDGQGAPVKHVAVKKVGFPASRRLPLSSTRSRTN